MQADPGASPTLTTAKGGISGRFGQIDATGKGEDCI